MSAQPPTEKLFDESIREERGPDDVSLARFMAASQAVLNRQWPEQNRFWLHVIARLDDIAMTDDNERQISDAAKAARYWLGRNSIKYHEAMGWLEQVTRNNTGSVLADVFRNLERDGRLDPATRISTAKAEDAA